MTRHDAPRVCACAQISPPNSRALLFVICSIHRARLSLLDTFSSPKIRGSAPVSTTLSRRPPWVSTRRRRSHSFSLSLSHTLSRQTPVSREITSHSPSQSLSLTHPHCFASLGEGGGGGGEREREIASESESEREIERERARERESESERERARGGGASRVPGRNEAGGFFTRVPESPEQRFCHAPGNECPACSEFYVNSKHAIFIPRGLPEEP